MPAGSQKSFLAFSHSRQGRDSASTPRGEDHEPAVRGGARISGGMWVVSEVDIGVPFLGELAAPLTVFTLRGNLRCMPSIGPLVGEKISSVWGTGGPRPSSQGR